MSYTAPFCKDSIITIVDIALIKFSDEDMEHCEVDELINEFADGEPAIDTVYGYVPKEIVIQLIEKHGGLVESEIRLLELAKKMRG